MTAATTVTIRGLTIGAGPDVFIADDHLQFGAVDVRSSEEPMPSRDGVMFGGADLLGGRDLLVPVLIRSTAATQPARILEAIDTAGDLGQAWAPAATDLALSVTIGGARTFIAYGRPRPLTPDSLRRIDRGYLGGVLRFRMAQPHLFDVATVESAIDALEVSTTAGQGFPHGFWHGFGGTAVTGQVTHVPGGRVNTWPMIVLRGGELDSLRDPVMIRDDTGAQLGLELTVDQGVQAVIDMYRRRVYLTAVGADVMTADPDAVALADRTATVRHPVAADWWDLPPAGAPVRMTSNGEGTATVITRAAYSL